MHIHEKGARLTAALSQRLRSAAPVILFYVTQFVLVFSLFGSQYAMVLSGSTTLFQLFRKRRNDRRTYIQLFFIPFVLCLLAFLASQALWLCLLLNFTVPFFLVLWKSSQFDPKGYLGFAMTFVFLELRPPALEELPMQLLVVAFCHGLLLGALALYARLCHVSDPVLEIPASLDRLAQLLEQISRQPPGQEVYRELYHTAQHLHQLGFDRRRLLHLPDQRRNQYHLLALLFRRTSYLIDDGRGQEGLDPELFSRTISQLAAVTARCARAEGPEAREALLLRLRSMLERDDLPQGRLRIFYRDALRTLCLLCQEPAAPASRLPWRRVPWREVLLDFRQRCSVDRFEFRFALQLGVVVAFSCTASFLWDVEHAYWFPLHSFLLLQPSYEDSAHRMVTRPIGTALGCILVHLVYPHLSGVLSVFAFSLVMISLMYCCTPGTWVHPIFSTSFALTMATLTLEATEAIQLRLLYLGLAVSLVLIVNSLLFPNRKEQQFQSNLRELCRLQSVYWGMVRRRLRGPMDPSFSYELLSQFHLVHHAAYLYAKELPEADRRYYRSILLTTWAMFARLEQVAGMVQSELVPEEDMGPLDQLAGQAAAHIFPLQLSLARLSPADIRQRELRVLLGRYLDDGRKLLVLVHEGARRPAGAPS